MKEYRPHYVTHPGETLKEKLEEIGLGPKEFAIRADKPEKTITAVLNGESSITSEMAIQFERVLKISAEFWLTRQIHYDECIARQKDDAKIQAEILWMKSFPVKEMIKFKWIPSATTDIDKAKALLQFFGVASSQAWEKYYLDQKLKVAFRISLAQTKEPEAISAWLRRGEILARELECMAYDKNIFEEVLGELKNVMVQHPADFFKRIQIECLKAGVKVVYTPCLPKAPINGATRWINENPVIQLSGRYKRNDVFWFTFFHEAGHVIKHGKKDVFLEEVEYSDKDIEKEKEADEYAIRWTLTHDEFNEIVLMNDFTSQSIKRFAVKFNTHPAIIIGRLRRENPSLYRIGKEFIKRIELE